MKQQRKRRVDEALRHVLAEGMEELSDPAVGFVTVTGVDVTADLEHATVRVSVLGGAKRRSSHRSVNQPSPIESVIKRERSGFASMSQRRGVTRHVDPPAHDRPRQLASSSSRRSGVTRP